MSALIPSLPPARLLALGFALPVVAACSTATGAPDAAVVPTLASASWERGDTLDLNIDLMGQDLPIRITGNGVLEARFEPRGDGVRVSAGYRSWGARVTNPMAGTESADHTQIQGPTVFDLDTRGRPTVVSVPTATGSAASLFDGTQLAHELFPRLPGRMPGAGESWTDTIAYTSTTPGGETRIEMVVRYAAVGDTVVDGRRLLLIRGESEDRVEARGSAEGQSFRQNLQGNSRHTYLWDREAGIVHSSRVEGRTTGTMTIDAMGMSFSMRGDATTVMRRVEGG